jgi:hypothetical protein
VTTAATLSLISSVRAVLPRPPVLHLAAQVDQAVGIDRVRKDLRQPALVAEEAARRELVAVVARAPGLVAQRGLVGDRHLHRHHIADGARALVLEERAGALPPERVGRIDLGLLRRHRQAHRLVARLLDRVVDRAQLGLLADRGEALEKVGAAAQRQHGEHGEQGAQGQHQRRPLAKSRRARA